MTQFVEAAKGLTDLPIAVLSLIFAVLSFKKDNNKWGLVFLLTGVSGILGTVVHTFILTDLVKNIIWTVLYIILFESIRRFAVCLIALVRKPENQEKILTAAEIVLYFVCIILLYLNGKTDILVLLVFAVICLCTLVYDLIKYKYKGKEIYMLFGFLCIPVVLQVFAAKYPLFVVIEHLFLFIALFIVYGISKAKKEVVKCPTMRL